MYLEKLSEETQVLNGFLMFSDTKNCRDNTTKENFTQDKRIALSPLDLRIRVPLKTSQVSYFLPGNRDARDVPVGGVVVDGD